MPKGVFSSLRGLDAFGKTTEDVKIKTRMGAYLTLMAVALILTFTTMEYMDYAKVNIDTSIVVAKSGAQKERLTVKLNVTFPHIPCYLMSLDVTDVSGERQMDVTHNILKTRLARDGSVVQRLPNAGLDSEYDKVLNSKNASYCGSCYGGLEPANGCCNTCEEVRTAYVNRGWSFTNPDNIEQCKEEGWTEKLKEQSGEGCRVSGRVRINKVVGNIMLSPGRAFQASGRNMNDLVPYLREDEHKHDWSHTIHEFAFMGDDGTDRRKDKIAVEMRKRMGIARNPLDGVSGTTTKAQYMFQYFVKVVSTQLNTLEGKQVNTHQFSATHFERDLSHGAQDDTPEGIHLAHGTMGMPGTFINFEISPMLVVHTETRPAFAHFLTSVCAIIGGVITMTSILDGALYMLWRRGSGSSSTKSM